MVCQGKNWEAFRGERQGQEQLNRVLYNKFTNTFSLQMTLF